MVILEFSSKNSFTELQSGFRLLRCISFMRDQVVSSFIYIPCSKGVRYSFLTQTYNSSFTFVKQVDDTWTATALWCCMSFLILILLGQNLSKKSDGTNDKLCCDRSTGGWREKDMMTAGLSPGGFTEVMLRMHVLWRLVFLPRQISNNGMRRNDQGSHTRVTLQHELSLFALHSLLPPTFFPSDDGAHTMLFCQVYSSPCSWC